ncbi:MAG: hypothetical protein DRI57_14130 [Deltaproteobacteria bacterium]|nr:MAG: hypothetical protein DRI57_14130 [Deltaproteobacteria bacterium]
MIRFNRYFLPSAILIFAAIFFSRTGYSETLYVFYPTTTRSQIVQKELDRVCPGIEITVFGRYEDFKAKIGMNSPDAILTKDPVIRQIGGYLTKMEGARKGATDEPYVLVSVDKKVDPHNIGNAPIGIFDILGRKGMKKFVSRYFTATPRLRRVSKMEDMLQLLTFNMADAILIPEIHVNYFKEISKLNFAVTPVPGMRVGIIALGVKQGKHAPQIIKGLSGMDNKIKALVEVDDWNQQ